MRFMFVGEAHRHALIDHTPSGGCDALVRRLIDKIAVRTAAEAGEDEFTVKFKPGVTVDVNE